MQVKRFVAADMRRALELVRQELGPDAIILSSGRTPEGVELLTTMGTDNELMQLQQQPLGRMAFASASPMLSDGAWCETALLERASPASTKMLPAKMPQAKQPRAASHNNQGKTGKQLADDIEQARARMIASRKAEASAQEFLLHGRASKPPSPVKKALVPSKAIAPVMLKPVTPVVKTAAPSSLKPAAANAIKPVASAAKPAAMSNNLQLQELQAEIADMRFLLEKQLNRLNTQPVTGSSILGSVSRRLERLGLPADIVSNLVSRCTKSKNVSDAWLDALAHLARQLPVNSSDIVDKGGVFAFVGPTGVGKTTTIGKLAARYVLKYGAEHVALITTDTYRIASHDQLRSIARILRVPVRVVDECNSLESLLHSLRHCSLVLIDTAGFRHGDPHLKAQLSILAKQPKVKNYLVLSCNSQKQMLKASVHAYGQVPLQGCILTKLDETASMGEALGVVMQNTLPVAYTTDGQDIPKNIDVARAHHLVAKAAALLKKNSATAVS
jgi:flagellar biosynthesis protein FlhF